MARRLLIVNAEKKSGPIHLIGKGIENFSESLKKMKIFDNVFGVHEAAMKLRQDRLGLLSENLVNAETPNYKAKDLDFRKAMNTSLANSGVSLEQTHGAHMKHRSLSSIGGAEIIYRNPMNPAADGNTVEAHYEQSEFGKETARYMATVQFIENRIGGIRRAFRGE